MATKVKPTRLNVTWVPQVGKVPTYVDKNTFAWWNWWGGGWYWRFLSLWDCSTWMPISFPEATPYTYLTWDYFLVEVVDSSDPATNYKPDWATYTWAASTTVESDSVAKWDVYVYDWTVWLLQSNSDKSVSFSNITWQPTDNLNLAADLNAKQDNLTAWTWIDITSNTVSTASIFWESSTAAATVQKEVSIPSITTLNVWQVIIVKPTVTSTVANSTLKLNSFPAYSMLYNGANITTSTDSIVRWENIPSVFVLDEVSWTKYWRFVAHWLDSNTTYTINYYYDAWKYKAWTWTYAITRYSLCMMKPNMTWEKITATNANYTTATTKSVNTNWFVLNQIRYYNTTTAIGANTFVGVNTFQNQAASVNAAYSFNCGTAPVGRSTWTYIYLVWTIWVDWLFYLDTTTRWSHTLPSTNDGKLYIRLWVALTDTDATMSFLADRPIFYYDNWIKVYQKADNKQDKSAMVTTLVWADNDHYPTAKAVTDAWYVTSSIIDDTAFAASWDWDTTHAPTKNAVYDKIDAMDTAIAWKQDELVSGTNIRTINWTSILWSWDITTPTWIPSQTWEAGKFLTTDWTYVSWWTPSWWADYSWVTKTISWWTLEIWLRTIVDPPTSNFTLTKPATLQEWEEYVIRTISTISYTMTLGTWFTNPRNVNTTLSANATDQYVFLAIWGELELQPLVATGS